MDVSLASILLSAGSSVVSRLQPRTELPKDLPSPQQVQVTLAPRTGHQCLWDRSSLELG